MALLILGILLFIAAHLFNRLAPGARAALGRAGMGVMAAVLVLALVLIVTGYRRADFVPLYSPVPGIGHLNNLMMLVAVFLFGVGGTKGTLYPRIRHPMLWGTVIWAVAHLLVNGDLASVVLFGGMLIWAGLQMSVINRTAWERPAPGAGRGLKGDAMNLAGTLVLYGIIAGVHIWAGHNPFLGTYG